MRVVWVCVVLALIGQSVPVAAQDEQVKKRFSGASYSVHWGDVPNWDAAAGLEIGSGNGHGQTLRWTRFRPIRDGMDVLSIHLDERLRPYESKWPPDRPEVSIRHARMELAVYASLLRRLAVVDAAKLTPAGDVWRGGFRTSWNDFWVQCNVDAKDKTLMELNWAGYEGTLEEVQYAKPVAAVSLADDAISEIDFKDHALTDEERAWASAKFKRDWKRFNGPAFWWVRARSIMLVGLIGDSSALPTLRDILRGDPTDGCMYHAINAVTRLTGKDVRTMPTEEMDVEKVRVRVLELLPNN